MTSVRLKVKRYLVSSTNFRIWIKRDIKLSPGSSCAGSTQIDQATRILRIRHSSWKVTNVRYPSLTAIVPQPSCGTTNLFPLSYKQVLYLVLKKERNENREHKVLREKEMSRVSRRADENLCPELVQVLNSQTLIWMIGYFGTISVD